MHPNNYAPLIEFHGFTSPAVTKLRKLMTAALSTKLMKKDYNNLIFSEVMAKVEDVELNKRPYIRFYSSDFDIVHKVVDVLKELKWKGEIEFIKITNYFDLR